MDSFELKDQESSVCCSSCGARLRYSRRNFHRPYDGMLDWTLEVHCPVCQATPTPMQMEHVRHEFDQAIERYYREAQDRALRQHLGEVLNHTLQKMADGRAA